MRLITFREHGTVHLGAVTGDQVVVLDAVAPDMLALIDRGDEGLQRARAAVAAAERSGCVSFRRASATMRNSASAPKKTSLDSADGPCLKKGGGVRSRVPRGMVEADCPSFGNAAPFGRPPCASRPACRSLPRRGRALIRW